MDIKSALIFHRFICGMNTFHSCSVTKTAVFDRLAAELLSFVKD